MVVVRVISGHVIIMTLTAMTGIGTGANALIIIKTITVTQTNGAITAVAGVIRTGGVTTMILTVPPGSGGTRTRKHALVRHRI
jgi:hypothetical protein